MEVNLSEDMPVIALGGLAFIKKLLPDGRLEIQLKKDRSRHVVTIEEIEVIRLDDEGRASGPQFSADSYKFHDTSIESSESARIRYGILRKCIDGELTILEAAEKLKLSQSTIYKLLRGFAKENGVVSLLANKKGRKPGLCVLEPKVESIIDAAIKKHYRGRAATVKAVHLHISDECSKADLPVPSLSTVQRRVRKLTPLEKLIATHGAEYAKDRLGLKTGKLVLSRPLEQVQIDHTEVDLLLACDGQGKVTVRPWLTVAVDTYTRVVLGFYLALHPPSAVSVAAALSMACLTKTSFLSAIGASSATYPFYGKPEIIFVDNAAEFRSPKFVSACALNDIQVEWRPIGRKHWGGVVERLIGTLMRKVHSLPGSTMADVSQRPKGQIKAVVTFPQLLAWLALQIEIYHNTSHRGLQGRSPAHVWLKAFQTEEGKTIFPPIISDPFSFKLDFMPEERRDITAKGIQFKGNFYSSPGLALHVGRKAIVVKYDPFRMKKIWVYINGDYIEADYGLTRPDMNLAEVSLSNRYSKQRPWLTSDQSYSVRNEAERVMKGRGVSKMKKESYDLANSYLPEPDARDSFADASSSEGYNFTPTIYPVKE